MDISKQELDMAKLLIDSMTQKFDISAYHDKYQQKLRNAITTKINGNEIVSQDTGSPNKIIDMMEALTESVDLVTKKPINSGIA